MFTTHAPIALPEGPLKVGQPYVSRATEKMLQPLGWQPGDPIPPQFAEKLKELQVAQQEELQEAEEQLRAQHAEQPTAPQAVPIESLSADRQQALAEMLKSYKASVVSQPAHPATSAAGSAWYQQMTVAAAQAQAAEEQLRAKHGEQPATPPEAASPTAGPTAGPATGALPAVRVCPRCRWDVQRAVDPEPTDQDRLMFVAGVLGQTRLLKSYELLAGQAVVTFRSLLATEADLLFQQLGHESRQGAIGGDGDYWMKWQIYRLVLGVQQVKLGQKIVVMPEVSKLPLLPGDAATVLPVASQWFHEHVLPQEVLRRLVAAKHQEFQRLVETLEAQATNPDFWRGIGV